MATTTQTPETLKVLEDEITVLAGPQQTIGSFELFDVTGPEGSGPPPHAHPWVETFTVLDGEILVVAGETEHRLTAGQTAVVGYNEVHTFRIESPSARFIVATSGAGAGQFFTDLAATVGPGAPNEQTLPQIIDVAKRNGLTSPLF